MPLRQFALIPSRRVSHIASWRAHYQRRMTSVTDDELAELDASEVDAVSWISQILREKYETTDLVRVLTRESVLLRLAERGYPGIPLNVYGTDEHRAVYLFLDACAHLHVPTQHMCAPADLIVYRRSDSNEKLSRSQDVRLHGRQALERRRRLFQTVLAFVQAFHSRQPTAREKEAVVDLISAKAGSSSAADAARPPSTSSLGSAEPLFSYRGWDMSWMRQLATIGSVFALVVGVLTMSDRVEQLPKNRSEGMVYFVPSESVPRR